MPTITEDNMCVNPAHRDPDILFGRQCLDCVTLPIFADDSMYLFSSNNRHLNQERVENVFVKIRDSLNSHGLQINESKTWLTEFMTKQKHARLRGIPPELTVTEKVADKKVAGKIQNGGQTYYGCQNL